MQWLLNYIKTATKPGDFHSPLFASMLFLWSCVAAPGGETPLMCVCKHQSQLILDDHWSAPLLLSTTGAVDIHGNCALHYLITNAE